VGHSSCWAKRPRPCCGSDVSAGSAIKLRTSNVISSPKSTMVVSGVQMLAERRLSNPVRVRCRAAHYRHTPRHIRIYLAHLIGVPYRASSSTKNQCIRTEVGHFSFRRLLYVFGMSVPLTRARCGKPAGSTPAQPRDLQQPFAFCVRQGSVVTGVIRIVLVRSFAAFYDDTLDGRTGG
jgi:hypothetical protein